MADKAADFELFGALDLQCRIKAHQKIAILVLLEDLVEALLKDPHLETVDQELVAIGDVAQRMHL